MRRAGGEGAGEARRGSRERSAACPERGAQPQSDTTQIASARPPQSVDICRHQIAITSTRLARHSASSSSLPNGLRPSRRLSSYSASRERCGRGGVIGEPNARRRRSRPVAIGAPGATRGEQSRAVAISHEQLQTVPSSRNQSQIDVIAVGCNLAVGTAAPAVARQPGLGSIPEGHSQTAPLQGTEVSSIKRGVSSGGRRSQRGYVTVRSGHGVVEGSRRGAAHCP